MKPRFLFAHGPAQALRAMERAPELLRNGMVEAARTENSLLLIGPGTDALLLPAGKGVVIGKLFRRDQNATPAVPGHADEIVGPEQEPGAGLIRRFWGSYAAVLQSDAAAPVVVRDPSGGLPVYHASSGALRLIGSNPEDLLPGLTGAPDIDPDFVAHWLVYPKLRTARTGIRGVRELLPGTSLQGKDVRPLWQPWEFTSPGKRIGEADEASAALRDELLRTIPALAPPGRKLLLELSGGLDSSIIACALKQSGVPFSSVNFFTDTPDGDERRYARLVADVAATPLAELRQDRSPDLSIPKQRRVRPGLNPILQPLDQAIGDHALDIGAQALMSGGGGDNVFCYLTTAAPAVDAFAATGPAAGLRALRDIAELCDTTLWTASRFAARKLASHSRRPPWKKDLDFLADDLAATRMEPHPWLQPPSPPSAGTREHVEAIVRIFDFLDTSRRTSTMATIYPLLAQPIVELCLRVPSWLWLEGGRDRAVARRAMAGLLPAEIVQRRTKGRLEAMFARAFSASRPALRALLLDGWLARERVIDRMSVESYLSGTGDAPDTRYFRIFDLATMELWLRSWRD